MKWHGRLLLFLLTFFLANSGKAQNLSFTVKDASLAQVFLLIEQQSGFHFIYTSEQLKSAQLVTVSFKDEKLPVVLEACFANQPLAYSVDGRNIIVRAKSDSAKLRSLKGRIVDQEGGPINGATVQIKGSELVSVSDASGEFLFEQIAGKPTLIVSSVQIEQVEFYAGERGFVEIKVARTIGVLDETIVIAYGETNRRYNTGSVASIKSKTIERSPVADPLSALTGRIAGLQVVQNSGLPGSIMTVRLRGQNSIANGNDPLYVVDGTPFPSTTMSGIFGGAGGVVTSPLNSLNPADIESIEVLKDADATAIYGSRGANGVILITTKKGKVGKGRIDLNYYAGIGAVTGKMKLLRTPEYLEMRREAFYNDGIIPNAASAPDLLVWDTTRYTDWQDKLIGNNTGVQNINLSYSGGTDLTQFRTTLGYRRETTVYPGNFGMDKFSAATNVTHRSADHRFSISSNSEINFTNSKLPTADLSNQIFLPPNAPAIYTEDGMLNWENSTWTNPFASLRQIFNFKSEYFHSSLNVGYQVIPQLHLRINSGFTYIQSNDHATTPSTFYDPRLNIQGQARFGETTLKTIITEPQISYETRLKEFSFSILAGLTLQASQQDGLYQVGLGYNSDELLGSLRAAGTIVASGETDIKYRYAGLFSRFTGRWRDKFLANITLRRDGSSRYGEANRFASFGSVGVGWILSNEKWLKEVHGISFAKLRGSVGITGNDQIGDYRYLDLYAPASNPYLGATTFLPQQLYNPEYGWERVRKLEAGLELGLLANKIYLTASYYHNLTTNQLTSYPLPAVTGFTGILRNLPARIQNTGLEMDLSFREILNGDVKWSANLNLSVPRNKLIEYEGIENSSYANRFVVGQPLFIEKKFQLTGIDPATGLYQFTDFDNDGRISSPNDRQVIIFTGQQYFGGLENQFVYRKVALSFLIQFVRQKHGESYLSRFVTRPGALANQPYWIMDRWQKPGDFAVHQRFVHSNSAANSAFSNYLQSDAAYGDASFLRLRNLNLSVDLLSEKWKEKGIAQAKLIIQGHNLLTITSFKGLDPETKSLLPPVKMITAGIQVTF